MYKLEFPEPRDVIEVREPFVEACTEAAALSGLYAHFRQLQQHVWDTKGGQQLRIGNGKHKIFRIDFQREPMHTNRPTVVSGVILRSLMRPSPNWYGGFSYEQDARGEYPKTYHDVTVCKPSELHYWRPEDPSAGLYVDVINALHEAYGVTQPDVQPGLF
jgi:hypothetical protein